MSRDEQIDLIIEGMIDTFAFRHFFNNTEIQQAARRVAKIRGGERAERVLRAETYEAEVRKQREKQWG